MSTNQPVNFEVIELSQATKVGFVKASIRFNSNQSMVYNYIRKYGFERDSRYIIISGCKITFTNTFDVVGVERVYDTNGKYRRSTESISGRIKQDIGEKGIIVPDVVNDAPVESEEETQHDIVEEQKPKYPKGPVKHPKYDQIMTCIEVGIPVYLTGPAGSGKNHTVEQIAKELGWNFYFSNSIQQEYKLTGFIDAGGRYHETEFYKACTDEEECVFFLDEMDASIPDVLVLLNMAIANGYFEFPNGRANFDNVHFVAAGNTVGNGADDMYTGRMVLDSATLDRFAIIEFDYDENVELKLTKGNTELIDFVHDLRKLIVSRGIRHVVSYRCEIMVTKLEKAGLPIDDIMKIVILKGLDKDTINTIDLYGTTKYHDSLRRVKLGV